MSKVSICLLLLCISMHECNARHFDLLRKEGTGHFVDVVGDLENSFKEDEGTRGSEKNGKIQFSSKEGLQQARKTMNARLMLESTQQKDDETQKSKEEGVVTEDVVMMDYAQPHRKPPIHNEEH